MYKTFGSITIILIFTIMTSLPLLNTSFAQTSSNSANFSMKGVVTDGKFQGVTLWTILHENNGTIIVQTSSGYGITHFTTSPSTACAETLMTCVYFIVKDNVNNNIFKVGDTAVLSIDLKAKQEIISLLTGPLSGSDVKTNISKIWGNTTIPSMIITNTAKPTTANITASSPSAEKGAQNFGPSFNDIRAEYQKLETSFTDLQTRYQKLETTLDDLHTDHQKLESSIDEMRAEPKKSDSMVQGYGITALVNAVGIIVAIAILQTIQSNKIEKITKQVREMNEKQDKIVQEVKEVYASGYVSWVHQITFNYEQITRILYKDGYLNKQISENREKVRRELMDHYDHDLFITCPKIEMLELVKVFGHEIANKIFSSTTHLRAGDWQPYEDKGMALMIDHYKTYIKKAIELKDVLLQFCDKNTMAEDLKHRETYQFINATG